MISILNALHIIDDMCTTWNEERDEALNVAVNVLRKANIYRFHDLRICPLDLPTIGERIIFYLKPEETILEGINSFSGSLNEYVEFENDDFEGYVTKQWYKPVSEVIGWRYMPGVGE